MKRSIVIIGACVLLLFVFSAMVSGERITSDSKTPAKIEQSTTVDQATLVHEDVHQPQTADQVSATLVHEDVHQPQTADQVSATLVHEDVHQPQTTDQVSATLVHEDVHQPQVVAPSTTESTLEPTDYDIPWQSINAGGDDLSSTNYRMMFSVGQSVIGYATSDNYEAGIGYWYGAGGGGGCECGLAGDVNNDASTDPLDVSYLVNKVYLSQDALYDYTATCPYPNGDVNCDDSADPLDVSYLVNKVYLSQDALCERCP